MAVDASGNVYIADTWNHRVRRVSATTGTVATVAGSGDEGFGGDGGPAVDAQLCNPMGVAVDASGNVYIADWGNTAVRRVDASTRDISTVYGTGGSCGFETGGPDYRITDVAVDAEGNVYIANPGGGRVDRLDATTGEVSSFAGTGDYGFTGDGGPGNEARLTFPLAVAVDAAGHVYIADADNHRVRRVDASTGVITTFAGHGVGDGGSAIHALLDHPMGVAVDAAGNLLIADSSNHRVRRVDAGSGDISTLAGSPKTDSWNPGRGTIGGGFGGDGGPAAEAQLDWPSGVAVDAFGNAYIADADNHRVRRVDATGVISTFAGTGGYGFGGDGGPAIEAQFENLGAVAVDAAGNVYVADNNRVRRVDAATGVISTFAGSGERGFGGDGGPAVEAHLRWPAGIAVDAGGNVYIADTGNHRVRRVDAATGVISTFAGSGERGFGGDGEPASDALLAYPTGVAVDESGNVYIADTNNDRVRRVDADTGTISTLAGSGEGGFGGDGLLATDARLNRPRDVAVDASGNVYIADRGNDLVRRVAPPAGPVDPPAGIELDSENAHPSGIALAGGLLYVADYWDNKVYAYAMSGERRSGFDFELEADNTAPSGIVLAGGLLHVADRWDKRVYAYTMSGERRSGSDFNLDPANSHAEGMTYKDGLIFVLDAMDENEKVYAYGSSGERRSNADFDVDPYNFSPFGIAHADSLLYVADTYQHKVYAYNAAGEPRLKFDLDPENSDGFNQNGGMAYGSGWFFVVDGDSKRVFVYAGNGGRTDELWFDLDPDNSDAENVAHADGLLFVLDGDGGKAYAYATSGERRPGSDFDLDADNEDLGGIAYVDGVLYVADWLNGKVYVYTTSGERRAASDFDLDANNGYPQGVAYGDGIVYVADEIDDRVYAYTTSGERRPESDFTLTSANDCPVGMAYADGMLYVADGWDQRIYAYTTSGARRRVLELDIAGSNVGVAYGGGRFFAVNRNPDRVSIHRRVVGPQHAE